MTAPSWQQAVRRLAPGQSDHDTFRALVISRALPYPRSVGFLVFAGDATEPTWILRCHRDRSVAAREVLVLTEMQRRGYRVQPELIGSGPCEDLHTLLLRFCPGRHGTVQLSRRAEFISAISSTLGKIQRGLAAWSCSTFETRPPDTADLRSAVERAAAGHSPEGRLVPVLEDARECLVRSAMPALPQHGDCCTTNLLWDDGTIRILDWEHFGVAFEPFLDIWMFALSLCWDSGDLDATSLFRAGANATAAESAVRRYAEEVELSAGVGRQVFPLAIARSIHLNVAVGRMETARRLGRVLDAYLADAPNFMSRLEV